MSENNIDEAGSDWSPVVPVAVPQNSIPKASIQSTTEQAVEGLCIQCIGELESAHKEKYDSDKAELTASMFLEARMHLAEFIGDVELRARQAKIEIDRIKGQQYFVYLKQAPGKKPSDAMLEHYVDMDDSVLVAKKESADAESLLKKWNYIMDCLKEGHVYFRTIGKGKNDF